MKRRVLTNEWGRHEYPWDEMEIGDYFIVENRTGNSVRAHVSKTASARGQKYSVFSMGDNRYRVVRVKAGGE